VDVGEDEGSIDEKVLPLVERMGGPARS
jgi:hypothetical protein